MTSYVHAPCTNLIEPYDKAVKMMLSLEEGPFGEDVIEYECLLCPENHWSTVYCER